ncbi:MAG: hypothetical protein M8353_00460 [ANME-2 cluster archaeon]|nr:hypothetical protein [ANME-2 cluster archaeon]
MASRGPASNDAVQDTGFSHGSAGTGAVHSHSQREGPSNPGNPSSSDSIGQFEEPDLLRADASELHRFRLAGRPGFNGIQPQWSEAAIVRCNAAKLFDVLAPSVRRDVKPTFRFYCIFYCLFNALFKKGMPFCGYLAICRD